MIEGEMREPGSLGALAPASSAGRASHRVGSVPSPTPGGAVLSFFHSDADNDPMPGNMNQEPPLVLCLLQCSNLGGMEQDAYRLLEALAADGRMRFRVASPRPAGPGWSRVLAVDPEARAFEYRGRFGWRTLPEFRRHVRERAAGVAAIWIVGTCTCCLLASRGLSRRIILGHHFHHFENGRGGAKWSMFYRLLCGRLADIVYPTAFTRDEALRIAPWLREGMRVVRYGFAAEPIAPEVRASRRAEARLALGLPADAFIVGNGGWLIPRKRFDVFLRTAAVVARSVPQAYFVICGDGSERAALEALAAELGLSGKVRFAGWVKGLTQYYQSWDVCLFNSDFDAFGRTPIEAAAEGCAVVASVTHGGLSEFVRDEVNGFILPRHDPEWLGERVIRLAREPALRARLIASAYETLATEYSPEAEVEGMRAILRPEG